MERLVKYYMEIRFKLKIDIRSGKEIRLSTSPIRTPNGNKRYCKAKNGIIIYVPNGDLKYFVEPSKYNEKVCKVLYGVKK